MTPKAVTVKQGAEVDTGKDNVRRKAFPALTAVVVLLGASLIGLAAFRHRTPAGSVPFRGVIQVLPLVNQTGDPAVGGAVTVAIEILLTEARNFAVRPMASVDWLEGGSDGSASQLRSGAPAGASLAVLSGTLSRSGAGYTLHLRVADAVTRTELTSAEETAASAEALPDAIARAVAGIRHHFGENGGSVSSVALAQEASTDMAALATFGEGEARAETGDVPAAIAAYQHALALDRHFQLARMRLVTVLSEMHALRDAYTVAQPLRSEASIGGSHLQAERTYLLARLGDEQPGALRAANEWRSSRPQDVEAQEAAASELLAAGRFREAQEAALAATALNPYRREGESLVTRAQIASDHPDAAWSTQTGAYRYGVGSPGLSLAAAFLREDEAGMQAALASLKSSDDPVSDHAMAIYLANRGRVEASSASYDQAIASAERTAAISSAADFFRGERALNRALAGRCTGARADSIGTATGQGRETDDALLLGKIAEAWCSAATPVRHAATPVRQTKPVGSGTGLLEASERWKAGDLRGALTAIDGDVALEQVLLRHLVRGRLHALLGEMPAALAEYNPILSAPGAAYLTGLIVYPAALVGSADAYASMGDTAHAQSARDALDRVRRRAVPVNLP